MDTFLEFVANIFEVDKETLSLDLAYASIPQWDSLMHLRLVSEFEDEYGIEIAIDDVPNMKTLKDFYSLIDGDVS